MIKEAKIGEKQTEYRIILLKHISKLIVAIVTGCYTKKWPKSRQKGPIK